VNRQQQREQTRKRLLEVAAEMFVRHGVRATRTNDVAAAAGVSVGTIYAHFGDKDGLLGAVLMSGFQDLQNDIDALFERLLAGEDLAMRAFGEAFFAFAEANPDRARLLFGTEILGTPVGDRLAQAVHAVNEQRIRQCAEAGILRPGMHPAVTARGVLAVVVEVLRWWLSDPDAADREEVISTMTEIWSWLVVQAESRSS
jgi:AcrR family transcriptional regulator